MSLYDAHLKFMYAHASGEEGGPAVLLSLPPCDGYNRNVPISQTITMSTSMKPTYSDQPDYYDAHLLTCCMHKNPEKRGGQLSSSVFRPVIVTAETPG